MATNRKASEKKELVYDWAVFAKTKGLEQFGPNSMVKTIDGGSINYVYRMTSDMNPKLTLIVKHGDNHVKEFPAYSLSLERTTVEFWAMKLMYKFVPGSVPIPLLFNSVYNYIVMEDLGSYDILRDKLIEGSLDISVFDTLSLQIAKLHRFTHKATLEVCEHQTLVDFCETTGMQLLGVFHVFVDPINRKGRGKYTTEVEEFQKDETLWGNWQKLKAIDKEQHDCLIHGDFHTSSVMVKGKDVKIFDLEFAHMGSAGNDFGHMLANLIKSYLDHAHYPLTADSTFDEHMTQGIYSLVDTYFKEAKEYLNEGDYAKTVSETAGFTGARLLRRVWGLQELGEDLNQSLTERGLLRIGYRLLRDFGKITTPKDLKGYLLNEKE